MQTFKYLAFHDRNTFLNLVFYSKVLLSKLFQCFTLKTSATLLNLISSIQYYQYLTLFWELY